MLKNWHKNGIETAIRMIECRLILFGGFMITQVMYEAGKNVSVSSGDGMVGWIS